MRTLNSSRRLGVSFLSWIMAASTFMHVRV